MSLKSEEKLKIWIFFKRQGELIKIEDMVFVIQHKAT